VIVVDGAIFNNDLSTLNTEDILDVNILKGSSAAAIYGSDASNGVIVINTKRGTRGKPSVTFSSHHSIRNTFLFAETPEQVWKQWRGKICKRF
jgi:TonB-dependent SusC/RagA subfamily outer membrane receptor